MATLGVGTSSASGHQTAPSHYRNFSEETYLTQYLPWVESYEGWEGLSIKLKKKKKSDQSNDPQRSVELENCK